MMIQIHVTVGQKPIEASKQLGPLWLDDLRKASSALPSELKCWLFRLLGTKGCLKGRSLSRKMSDEKLMSDNTPASMEVGNRKPPHPLPSLPLFGILAPSQLRPPNEGLKGWRASEEYHLTAAGDVTFVVQGETMKAHSPILCARSEVFEKELTAGLRESTSKDRIRPETMTEKDPSVRGDRKKRGWRLQRGRNHFGVLEM